MATLHVLLGAHCFASDGYAALRSVREPAGWREWPLLPALGRYYLRYDRGPCVGHGLQCGLENAILVDDGPHYRRGVSLKEWFDRQGIYGAKRDIALRGSGRVVVVTGVSSGTTEPAFVTAFDSESVSTDFAFQHGETRLVALCVSAALALLLGASAVASRLVMRARSLLDASRYRPGTRDEQGTIAFRDGTPSIALGNDGRSPVLAGPVLVRVRNVSHGSYRAAPTAHAASILDGDAPTLARQARYRASRALRVGFLAGLVSLGVASCGMAAGSCARMDHGD
jgi:hypothetical protein